MISVVQTGPYRLRLQFDDGVSGEVDLKDLTLRGGMFEPLGDPTFFAQVRVDEEAGTIVWPNGVDLDPLVLHSKVSGRPIELELPTDPKLHPSE